MNTHPGMTGAAAPGSLGPIGPVGLIGATGATPLTRARGVNAGQMASAAVMPSMAQSPSEFVRRVVPWPAPGESGYINLHWLGETPGYMPGRPYTDLKTFIDSAIPLGTTRDVYFCTTRQSEMKVGKTGKPLAVRRAQNATHAKAVWLDADVKPDQPEKNYTSTAALVTAFEKFLVDAALPLPSALVMSGSGGMHIYWISDRPLTITEWRPYAEGLTALVVKYGFKCDVGLTTDAARVLRVPGTYNRKRDPAKPVVLKGLGRDYDFDTALAHLAAIKPAGGVSATVRRQPFDMKAFPGYRPPAAMTSLNPQDSLAAGINVHDDRPLSPDEVIKNCPHFMDAMLTHGAGYGQGLWMLDVLASTFLDDGERWAHYMSKGHKTYDKDDTDAMYARKLRERQNNKGLGWPSCKAIRDAGCEKCGDCPHFGNIKSPLNLGTPASPPDHNNGGAQGEGAVNPVATLMTLRNQGADLDRLLLAVNETFAVVKYGSRVMVASIIGKELDFLKLEDFHNLLANLVVRQETEPKDEAGNPQRTTRTIVVSKYWLKWKHRRQYVGRGVVFEPGGPLEIPNDMLNLWRGFGIEPKQGDWSLLRNHICEVICLGNEDHFHYLIKLLAYGVQHPDRPLGVCVAIRGEEGAGKGFLWRNYGKLYGKHFKHIAQGEHLTGRFNAALAEACFVFLDEALWAGDRKGEQILKALVTEDTFQLERKFCDPIPVKNRLRIGIASNNDWIVPVGTRGRRNFVLDASDKYADEHDPAHAAYWEPLQAQFGDYASDDGRAAMLYDLLYMDLTGFNPRAVPNSAAKTEQKLLTQTGTEAWVFEILQESAVTIKSSHGFRHTVSKWDDSRMQISRDVAYDAYLEFSQARREYKPRTKEWWSRDLRKILKDCVSDERPRTENPDRKRFLTFRPLAECRTAYGEYVHADDIAWQAMEELATDTSKSDTNTDTNGASAADGPDWQRDETEYEPETDLVADEPDPDFDWECDELQADG